MLFDKLFSSNRWIQRPFLSMLQQVFYNKYVSKKYLKDITNIHMSEGIVLGEYHPLVLMSLSVTSRVHTEIMKSRYTPSTAPKKLRQFKVFRQV